MMKNASLAAIAAALALSACATGTEGPAVMLPAIDVPAKVETGAVGTQNADAADDPAIWRNSEHPADSLIVATDKKGGLYVYDLTGATRAFRPASGLNNVDLLDTGAGAIVVASDRSDPMESRITLFRLSGATVGLDPIGSVVSGAGEGYGICLQRARDAAPGWDKGSLTAYAAVKDGSVREVRIDYDGDKATGSIAREWKIATQIEGCVTDPDTGDLYVGEEMRGIWKIRTAQDDAQPELFAELGEEDGLVADVEGLALATLPSGEKVLIASSQGDNGYAIFGLSDGALKGRFRIAGGAIDGTSETDGIEVETGAMGDAFPGGMFIAQDGDNGNGTQNFKLVDWAAIRAALGL